LTTSPGGVVVVDATVVATVVVVAACALVTSTDVLSAMALIAPSARHQRGRMDNFTVLSFIIFLLSLVT
jgi:hypothetical protein